MGGFEQFGNLLQKNNALQTMVEDSGLGIAILVAAAPVNGEASATFNASWDADFKPWLQRRLCCKLPIENMCALVRESRELACCFLEPNNRTNFNPFACEYFAQSIMRRLGIATAPARISTVNQARELPPSDIVKVVAPGSFRLRWLPNGDLGFGTAFEFCLVSSALPNAASLDFAFRKWLRDSRSEMESGLRGFSNLVIGNHERFLQQVAAAVAKGCIDADYLYSEIHPTEKEIAMMERAAKWNGAQYLKICAARVFLGCSAAHFGNVLITTDAQLVSIDHESIGIEAGDDLKMLFRFTDRNSLSFRMLHEVAALTEEDIHTAISEIPAHSACGQTSEMEKYSVGRLRLFKSLCCGETVAPIGRAACLP